ncbi:MAG: hypothetical protein BGN92_07495 [Sphingobacteriales bacterium 41-5]|nr:MAG: hypothetical protein ABS67_00405 [Niabella sp. SCN 42-15]OJU26714.1 MAG: hypothetical protein BGN92_07495 [Sphingobacteriales bacterium 41-5]
MDNTFVITVTDNKALKLLRDLEELNLIKVIKTGFTAPTTKLSEKYKGIISKKKGEELDAHIGQMRTEWNSI